MEAFFLVTLLQIKQAVVGGALHSFITSLDEVVIALFITGGDGSTITRRIFASLRDELDPKIAGTVLIAISIIFVVRRRAHLPQAAQKKTTAVLPHSSFGGEWTHRHADM